MKRKLYALENVPNKSFYTNCNKIAEDLIKLFSIVFFAQVFKIIFCTQVSIKNKNMNCLIEMHINDKSSAPFFLQFFVLNLVDNTTNMLKG
jgi:hypothetical protein